MIKKQEVKQPDSKQKGTFVYMTFSKGTIAINLSLSDT